MEEKQDVLEILHEIMGCIFSDRFDDLCPMASELEQQEFMDKAEHFDFMFNARLRDVQNLAVEFHHEHMELTLDEMNKLKALYRNYRLVESNVDSLIAQIEGPIGSRKKARYVIHRYETYLTTGDSVTLIGASKNPSFGNLSNWISFIESLLGLAEGKYQDYLISLSYMHQLARQLGDAQPQ